MAGKPKQINKIYSPNWGGNRGKEPSVRRSVPVGIINEIDRIIREYKESKRQSKNR
jgi:hypothetical protein